MGRRWINKKIIIYLNYNYNKAITFSIILNDFIQFFSHYNAINYNNPLALRSLEGQGLPTDSWPHFHLSADRRVRSSSQFRDDMWSALRAVVGFLDKDHCYNSVATQIPRLLLRSAFSYRNSQFQHRCFWNRRF